jgi:cation diffusion facilitator CzcD-associated flavoprotein CzcO
MSRRRIGIIGAGPGGICAAIEMRRRGLGECTIFEKASGVGGVWFHNTYPGAACDVPSHLYSFSFELKRDWSRPYASQPEIKAYLEHLVDTYDVRACIRFDTAIAAAEWNDEASVWRLHTAAGDTDEFDVVIGAIGMFNDVSTPDIPGLADFAGHTFHSARWDHDHDLTGRRVAVIGSAASAVQFVPEIAKHTGQLYVYQRTANWVLPKGDTPYTPEELERFATDDAYLLAARREVYDRLDTALTFAIPEINAVSEQMGRDNLAQVRDPEVRRKLTPTHPYGCKRPLLSNEWPLAFNRPNVELVTDSIFRVTAEGVETVDGRARAVDSLILATGFDVTKYLSAIDVVGRDGHKLVDSWSEGAHAYLGIAMPGFPNLFQLYGPNTNNGSILFMHECQVGYIARHLERMDREGLRAIEVRAEVVDEYNRALQRDLDNVVVWNASCNNYYRAPSGRIVTQWPHSMTEYRRRTDRDDGDAYVALSATA